MEDDILQNCPQHLLFYNLCCVLKKWIPVLALVLLTGTIGLLDSGPRGWDKGLEEKSHVLLLDTFFQAISLREKGMEGSYPQSCPNATTAPGVIPAQHPSSKRCSAWVLRSQVRYACVSMSAPTAVALV